ncbi:MAG: peptidoglycan-binding protein [Marinosulfonomonas sp.]|nr:peptidoglycan-binding protein [Marinosulfonomonas sp.]
MRIHWMLGATALFTSLFLAACQQAAPPVLLPVSEADMIQILTKAPEDNRSGKCWGKDITPALVETVTEQVLVRAARPVIRPSPDGAPTYRTVQSPAVYKTLTQQKIITPRSEYWFKVPCAADMGTGFIATLQRALKSRGLFRGAVTGVMDPKTTKAVRWYQKQHGLDSGILSLAAARQLGLVAYARPNSN